jgi:large subunit ribosomal protein L15
MENFKLPKIVLRRKKRVGRGYGSGKGGHTVGRGQKGQKARGKVGVLFEGVKMKKSLIKRLPLVRGKGKFHPKLRRRERINKFKTKNAR